MLITRIKADHFKTYHALDLDLSVSEGKPLVLIGGANGGGKTTLFQAVCGALYGLKITTEQQFHELYNTGDNARAGSGMASEQGIRHITLEINFVGHLLGEEKPHLLSRRYEVSANGKKSEVVEYVNANFGGMKYAFNSAMPQRERMKHQTEIAKIIKANLPEELSRYFLFDAMESGALVREDEINRVIRENIESVMGFGKYIQLGRVAETLAKRTNAERLKLENEKHEYMRLLGEKRQLEARAATLEIELAESFAFRRKNKTLYEALQHDLEAGFALTRTIEQTKKEIETILSRERGYHSAVQGFAQNFEQHVILPNLAHALRSELVLIISTKNAVEKQGEETIKRETVERIVREALRYLRDKTLIEENVAQSLEASLVEYLVSARMSAAQADFYEFLNQQEVRALENLLHGAHTNPFAQILEQKSQLLSQLERLPGLERSLEEWRSHAASKDFSLIRVFERNENTIELHEEEQKRITADLAAIETRLHAFDIQMDNAADPKYDLLQKLKPFFLETGATLLQAKKRQIEMTMMQDLNINLVPYRSVIDRVELSDSLADLSFRMYHTSGNEIALNQLNTASKQIVVQCLLKALHQFGEYDPPVMIDTVMGALDEESRQTVLENYFPELSHQTILLSSDSEIRPNGDFDTLVPFISRAYTLKRDKERQCTEIEEGYFGKSLSIIRTQ
ncbi:MAG: AAA family ATPase [Ignavibacteria bacterium]|nr:AAA family ATPase [Ignavibacteria bacterium]